ncbi:MAG: hypothetical protein IKU27_06910, partial [Clostridia bacterium]|nr:hypothetical protein [Clostridia bacterium]
AVPDGLESLIALCCGREEVVRYLEAVRSGTTYTPGVVALERLRGAFRSAVVTRSGIARGAHTPYGELIKVETAMALVGLLDYRAQNGAYRPALVLSE